MTSQNARGLPQALFLHWIWAKERHPGEQEQSQQQLCGCWHNLWCTGPWCHQVPRSSRTEYLSIGGASANNVRSASYFHLPSLAAGWQGLFHIAPLCQDHLELASCLLKCLLFLMARCHLQKAALSGTLVII